MQSAAYLAGGRGERCAGQSAVPRLHCRMVRTAPHLASILKPLILFLHRAVWQPGQQEERVLEQVQEQKLAVTEEDMEEDGWSFSSCLSSLAGSRYQSFEELADEEQQCDCGVPADGAAGGGDEDEELYRRETARSLAVGLVLELISSAVHRDRQALSAASVGQACYRCGGEMTALSLRAARDNTKKICSDCDEKEAEPVSVEPAPPPSTLTQNYTDHQPPVKRENSSCSVVSLEGGARREGEEVGGAGQKLVAPEWGPGCDAERSGQAHQTSGACEKSENSTESSRLVVQSILSEILERLEQGGRAATPTSPTTPSLARRATTGQLRTPQLNRKPWNYGAGGSLYHKHTPFGKRRQNSAGALLKEM